MWIFTQVDKNYSEEGMKKNLLLICLAFMSVFLFANEEINMNSRMENFFAKIKRGEEVKVVAIGGSITTGFSANPIAAKCWAGLTGKWLKELAAQNGSKLTFYNRGVSGTDSAFGVARLDSHVLSLNPDFVIVEYAMNDQWLDAKVRKRTYESILRRILESSDAAILALYVNEKNPPYNSNQAEQEKICKYYDIPYVSWKNCLFADNPAASFKDYFNGEENVHPNNAGHAKIAEYIIASLDSMWKNAPAADASSIAINRKLPAPMTDKAFENAKYYHSDNVEPLNNSGWKNGSPVHSEWVSHGDAHKGWETNVAGAEMTFEVTGTCVGITYCESDQFRDALAWVEKEDGSISQKVPLLCYSSYRNGYYGWAYKELVNGKKLQKYIVHVQCSKRAPKSAEGKYCNITGILVGGEK